MKLYFTQMGAGDEFFARTSNAMFQGSVTLTLVRYHPYSDHSSSSHDQINID